MNPSEPAPMRNGRHYGLDWLRIAAFGLLILYHIGMVFSPWSWVIKTPHAITALVPPMALLTPWRLPLLFAVSGFASRHLFERSGGAGAFLRSRNLRLLVPLAFGMAVLIPPEMWVRVQEGGYPHGYLHFWLLDYWHWGEFYGRVLPSWEHLWFVAYLWAYTAVLALALMLHGPALRRGADRLVAWLLEGRRLLWVPIVVMTILRLALLFVVPEEKGLLTDWSGHARFVPIFLFGFILAGAPQIWPRIAQLWPAALMLALASGATVLSVELSYPGDMLPPHWIMAADRAARTVMAWTMILVLFHFADRMLNRDHRWRATIAEAVFPFYLIHQPVIVLIAWHTLPMGLSATVEFALLAAGTLAASTLFYLLGREVDWLRPLIGLSRRPGRRARGSSPQAA
ncbi:acyltransferase family protein [Sphingomonas sp.]|uniref:acyltransferase family protein n=1 Tax=Sphingomonas sp. TaxID=28214 RepID=UPI001EB23F6F|nr:acyltransferase family protein [Sphingomonas sp.]MBX3595709.1 acyltransferase family protein [Sphingomonas sp.]